eukprot:1181358-Prorocentrum_minimum.AAC.1
MNLPTDDYLCLPFTWKALRTYAIVHCAMHMPRMVCDVSVASPRSSAGLAHSATWLNLARPASSLAGSDRLDGPPSVNPTLAAARLWLRASSVWQTNFRRQKGEGASPRVGGNSQKCTAAARLASP